MSWQRRMKGVPEDSSVRLGSQMLRLTTHSLVWRTLLASLRPTSNAYQVGPRIFNTHHVYHIALWPFVRPLFVTSKANMAAQSACTAEQILSISIHCYRTPGLMSFRSLLVTKKVPNNATKVDYHSLQVVWRMTRH